MGQSAKEAIPRRLVAWPRSGRNARAGSQLCRPVAARSMRADALCDVPMSLTSDSPEAAGLATESPLAYASFNALNPWAVQNVSRACQRADVLSQQRVGNNRLRRAMAAVLRKLEQGSLLEEARRIKRTRLVYLEKLGCTTPRPIWVCEFRHAGMQKCVLKQTASRL